MAHVVVVGAGPIGVEAALLAVERGHEVTVLERDVVGASLRAWGPTRFFSPFGMNVSERVKVALGDARPADDALLTGPELVERVLEPVARGPLAGRVKIGHTVVKIGKDRMLRRDRPNHPMRAERPFRLLVDGPEGESIFEADVVLDATGVNVPSYLGSGGIPAPGERGVRADFVTTLGALHARLGTLKGARVLLVGHGHSAANAIVSLAKAADGVRVTWATRSLSRRPCVDVANDPLTERAAIVKAANDLAQDPPAWLTVERRAHVESFERIGEGVRVTLSRGRTDTYDLIVAMVGYGPDTSILSELAVELSPATEGAAGIQRALGNVTDCLSVPKIGSDDLRSGEPGFFMIGSKSYGRMPTFLLKDGLVHLESILDTLERR